MYTYQKSGRYFPQHADGMEEVAVRSSELAIIEGVKGYGALKVVSPCKVAVKIMSGEFCRGGVLEVEDPLKMKNARIVAIRIPPRISARLVLDNRSLG